MNDQSGQPVPTAANDTVPAFNFLDQAPILQNLLDAAIKCLPRLEGSQEGIALTKALKFFEHFSVLTLWGIGDVCMNDGTDRELTMEEKADAVNFMVQKYTCTDSDWSLVDSAEQYIYDQRKVK